MCPFYHSDEITWINDYHDRVYNAFLPYLDSGEKEWLQRQCAKI
ncbi:MAG: M24 family metallopeptidase C-terminal domain-containing protein [Saprospiraceae bacterium]|nr:M24 family metallopeptidase C-terminal domain-containing protein [Saprospiraceae bacterium]